MKNNIKRIIVNKLFVGLAILWLFIIITGVFDWITLNKEYQYVFIFSKSLLFIYSSILIGLLIYQKVTDKTLSLHILIVAGLYTCFGELFAPGYQLAFIQVSLAAVLIYDVSRLFNTLYLIVFAISYFLIFSLKYNMGELVVPGYENYSFDVKLAVITTAIFSASLYWQFSIIKEQKKLIESKFLDAGQKSSVFVHDLKNILFPLKTYSKLLARMDSNSEIKDIVKEIQEISEHSSEFILNFNQSMSFKEKIKEININEIMNVLNKFSKSKIKNLNIEVEQDKKFTQDFFVFQSIVSNLLSNSLDIFESKKIANPIVKVCVKNGYFSFEDNAGGMPSELLEKIQNKDFFTTKESGSGIGFFTIQGYVESLGSKLIIKNTNIGLKVMFKIKNYK